MLNKLFKLERTLISLDVETHDKVPPEKSRIVDMAFIIYEPEGDPVRWETLINPGVPISPGATAVHGITDEMVKDMPPFAHYAQKLAAKFSNTDFCGYNGTFDLRVFAAEFERVGIKWSYEEALLLDPLRLWQISKPRTLGDAVREFCEREPTQSHRAMGDTVDASDVAAGMLGRFGHLPKDLRKLHDLCFKDPNRVDRDGKFGWTNGRCTLTFGKWAGVEIEKVPSNYFHWMLKAEFSPDTKRVAQCILDGNIPVKEKTDGPEAQRPGPNTQKPPSTENSDI
jgi:DNA polymerase-3 subunit epsilon